MLLSRGLLVRCKNSAPQKSTGHNQLHASQHSDLGALETTDATSFLWMLQSNHTGNIPSCVQCNSLSLADKQHGSSQELELSALWSEQKLSTDSRKSGIKFPSARAAAAACHYVPQQSVPGSAWSTSACQFASLRFRIRTRRTTHAPSFAFHHTAVMTPRDDAPSGRRSRAPKWQPKSCCGLINAVNSDGRNSGNRTLFYKDGQRRKPWIYQANRSPGCKYALRDGTERPVRKSVTHDPARNSFQGWHRLRRPTGRFPPPTFSKPFWTHPTWKADNTEDRLH